MNNKQFDNTNRGALWGNDRKRTDRDPDFTGNGEPVCPHCNNSTLYTINGWRRGEGENPNAPALRLSFWVKDEQLRAQLQPAAQYTAPTSTSAPASTRAPAASGQAPAAQQQQAPWEEGFNDDIPF